MVGGMVWFRNLKNFFIYPLRGQKYLLNYQKFVSELLKQGHFLTNYKFGILNTKSK